MDNFTRVTEAFPNDVENHKMTVLHDDGLYRHLHFSSGSFNQWFEIIRYCPTPIHIEVSE